MGLFSFGSKKQSYTLYKYDREEKFWGVWDYSEGDKVTMHYSVMDIHENSIDGYGKDFEEGHFKTRVKDSYDLDELIEIATQFNSQQLSTLRENLKPLIYGGELNINCDLPYQLVDF